MPVPQNDISYNPLSPPQEICPFCGRDIDYHWMKEPWLYWQWGQERPFWLRVTCNSCDAKEREQTASQTERSRIKLRLKKANLGDRFMEKTFENYTVSTAEQRETLFFCQAFAGSFRTILQKGSWILFQGLPGTGKGHLACAIIHSLIDQGYYKVHFVKARQVFREIKESWKKSDGVSEDEIIKRYLGYDMLVIDDLGVQFGTKAEQDILYDILDGRYENFKPLIATTNLSIVELENLIGNRMVDRFYDNESDSRILHFNWKSYRRKCR